MTTVPRPQIAVVGSGPSGCYLAQAILRALPAAELTIFDRLVSPFGLVRYGVAADHQHTKAITRQFDRLFQGGGARFAGGIRIGDDVGLAALRDAFDAVILATGLPADRPLDIPGADLPGVVGAGAVTRALNAHPDAQTRLPALGGDVVLLGAGNVALDVLRFLVKDRSGYAESDVADEALAGYLAAPARRVVLVSRSAAAASKGDPQMLRELAALPRARYSVPDPAGPADPASPADPADAGDRTAAARAAAVAALVDPDRGPFPGPEVELRFGAAPLRILGTERVTGVELDVAGERIVIPADAVISAIGFAGEPGDEVGRLIAETPPDPASGRLGAGLYRAGWAQRGPRGAIPENRASAKLVADELLADLASGALAVGGDRPGFAGLPPEIRARAVDYEHWLVLDAHERSTAPADRVRRKLPDHDAMVGIARGDAAAPHPHP
ncbi:hypothetical protein MUN77_05065 [Leucobacter allii]|uniref:hypothetical protein n=1 Tax=Leucobacter allii TaxID=2932247 RepID=UPI001FD0CF8F|nr:hypothetical protein [Leucobacter allii]UOR02684.1 hypothetical protein MUN77_05065 [Leucobacter allii]